MLNKAAVMQILMEQLDWAAVKGTGVLVWGRAVLLIFFGAASYRKQLNEYDPTYFLFFGAKNLGKKTKSSVHRPEIL